MQSIQTNLAPPAVGPYSQGQKSGNFIFFSGQIALSLAGRFIDQSIEKQTQQVFKNIEGLLTSQNIRRENICKATVFLTDMDDFGVVNEIYADFFGEHKPARSCVEVSKLPLGANIEIEVLAETN